MVSGLKFVGVGRVRCVGHGIAHWFLSVNPYKAFSPMWDQKMSVNVPVFWWCPVNTFENPCDFLSCRAVVSPLILCSSIIMNNHRNN
jgi:hypothetical protein